MAKAAPKKVTPNKESEPWVDFYDPKRSINGTFPDVLGVARKPKQGKGMGK